MKRILFFIVCISLVSTAFAKADVSNKNAQLFQAVRDGNLPAAQKLLSDSAASDRRSPSLSSNKPVGLTREQIKELSRLHPLQDTRDSVIGILGKPSAERDESDNSEMRKIMGDGYVEVFLPADNVQCRILQYGQPDFSRGTDFLDGTLTIKLWDSKYAGYTWFDQSAVLPLEALEKARHLAPVIASETELLNTLGPPAGTGAMPTGEVLRTYNFSAPPKVSSLGCDQLHMSWVQDSNGIRFARMLPFFTPKFDFSGGKLPSPAEVRGIEVLGQMGSYEREYRALVEKEVADLKQISDQSQLERVKLILKKLQQVETSKAGQFEILIVDSNKVNAETIRRERTTHIVIYTGLLSRLRNDDEVAYVIGHEMGHYYHLCVPVPFGLVQKKLAALLPPSVLQMFFRMSQMMEFEADLYSVELMTSAGLNPKAADRVLAVLSESSPSIPKEISTHPPHQDRRDMLAWYCEYRNFTK